MEKTRSIREIDLNEILQPRRYSAMGKAAIKIVPLLKIHGFNTHALLL
jgi:hypothetical protein